jgi:hypothetical protein
MSSGQLVLSDTGTQQCGSRDIEHRIIGSVDRTVGIAVPQFARSGQCALGFKSKVSRQRRERQRTIPSRATLRRKPGLGKRSGFNQCLNEMGTA